MPSSKHWHCEVSRMQPLAFPCLLNSSVVRPQGTMRSQIAHCSVQIHSFQSPLEVDERFLCPFVLFIYRTVKVKEAIALIGGKQRKSLIPGGQILWVLKIYFQANQDLIRRQLNYTFYCTFKSVWFQNFTLIWLCFLFCALLKNFLQYWCGSMRLLVIATVIWTNSICIFKLGEFTKCFEWANVYDRRSFLAT